MTNKARVTGIVVEYNPFHNGHIYHLQKTRDITQCDVLIAVMSPNFVQRGEPAFINKWDRTQQAIKAGVDIVIELPTCYALQSADYFAKGAIEALVKMGVSDLVFGSETNDIAKIHAQFQFQKDARKSYAQQMGTQRNPNDILGYQYMHHAKKHGIQVHTIQRTNAYHDLHINNTIASATAIRHAHVLQQDTSHTTPMALNNYQTHDLKDYEGIVHAILQRATPAQLQTILLVDEGIEFLLLKHAYLPLESMIEACVSSRYTRSRIRRTLMNIVLNIKKDDVQGIPHVRILGMNAKGRRYCRQLNHYDDYVTQFKHYVYKDLEYKATALYMLPLGLKAQEIALKQEVTCCLIEKDSEPFDGF